MINADGTEWGRLSSRDTTQFYRTEHYKVYEQGFTPYTTKCVQRVHLFSAALFAPYGRAYRLRSMLRHRRTRRPRFARCV